MVALHIGLFLTVAIYLFQTSAITECSDEETYVDLNNANRNGDVTNDEEDDELQNTPSSETLPWPNETVPYEISKTFSINDRNFILSMMAKIENISCVRFIPSTTEMPYVMITERRYLPCQSFIGYRKSGVRTIYLQNDCMDENGILHVLMHALGFRHEHNRYDRDNHVIIIRSNIQEKYLGNFIKLGHLEYVYFNMSYDFKSVTHYLKYDVALSKSLPTIETVSNQEIRADGLSFLDIRKINLLYQCSNRYSLPSSETTVEVPDDTPLHKAAQNGEKEKVSQLLADGANVNAKNKNGETPIHLAASEGKTEIVNVLLDFDVNQTEVTNNMKLTPLHLAVIKGNLDTVLALLQRGANVNAKGNLFGEPNGTSPLVTPLYIAAKKGQTQIVQVLLAKNVDANAKNVFGNTPIHAAAYSGKTEVVNLLLDHNVNLLNSRENLKRTPLHCAAENGHADTVKALIDKGADINSKANAGDDDPTRSEPLITPLHLASEFGHTGAVQALLTDSVDIHVKTRYGFKCIHFAAINGKTKVVEVLLQYSTTLVSARNNLMQTPLHFAANNGHSDTVRALLDKGADINAKANLHTDPHGSEPLITPLHLASHLGHVEAVRTLLTDRINVSAKNRDGDTCIHLAASAGKTKVVKDLLQFKVSLMNAQNNLKRTPLHWAVVNDHVDTVKALLDKHADINAKCNYGDDSSDTAPSLTPLHIASMNGNNDTVRLLLENEADQVATDTHGNTAIHLAASYGNTAIVNILLNFNKSLIYARNSWKYTPLHYAADRGHSDTVRALLDNGADINAQSNYGADSSDTAPSLTPLHIASMYGNNDTVRLLLENEADQVATDTYGNTAIHLAAAYGNTAIVNILLDFNQSLIYVRNSWKYTPLHYAAKKGYVSTVLALLDKGANVNDKAIDVEDPFQTEPLTTPLHLAVVGHSSGTVEALLGRNADVNAKDCKTLTPIHLAAMKGRTGIIKILIQFKANVNVEDNQKTTPLHWAILKGHPETVLALLEEGANVQIRNHEGYAALDLAIHLNETVIVTYLENYGSRTTSRSPFIS